MAAEVERWCACQCSQVVLVAVVPWRAQQYTRAVVWLVSDAVRWIDPSVGVGGGGGGGGGMYSDDLSSGGGGGGVCSDTLLYDV
jgi:uncharacterized membrane protein YgcG